MSGSLLDRWWPKIALEPTGCWLWTGARSWKGKASSVPYALARYGRHRVHVARVLYEELHGPIGNKHAHHVCGESLCVNPAHIQPVPARTNQALAARNTNQKRRGEP